MGCCAQEGQLVPHGWEESWRGHRASCNNGDLFVHETFPTKSGEGGSSEVNGNQYWYYMHDDRSGNTKVRTWAYAGDHVNITECTSRDRQDSAGPHKSENFKDCTW